jgi:hypothetical protein
MKDVRDCQKVLSSYPNAKQALNDAINIELKEGEVLFIPSFTWIQMEWKETGLTLNHYGWVSKLTSTQIQSVVIIEDLLKQVVFTYRNLPGDYAFIDIIKWISLGRHPRGIWSGAPVSFSPYFMFHYIVW